MRDFSYVKEVANGIYLGLKSDKSDGHSFNLTGGSEYSIKDLAMCIKEFIPGAEIREIGERKIDTKRGQLDISKAKEILGYSPKYDLKKGISEYIKWYMDVFVPLANMEVKNKPKI
jgi:nucleoside-diphosphate-sugar epimerase